jgi:hypothetical protein
MMNSVFLVCGSRGKFQNYRELVRAMLDRYKITIFKIIEGCCPDSADQFAEEWAKENNITIKHFPANTGNYLKRNIEMVHACDIVLAFWDGFSYGTAHTIATAKLNRKEIFIIPLQAPENLNGKTER